MNHVTDKNILFSIVPSHMYKDKQGIKIKWKDAEKQYEKVTGYKRSFETLREYIKPDDRDKLWKISRGNLPTEPEKGLHYESRYIELDNEQRYTETDILLAHGYDPEIWTVQSAGSTGSKIGTGKNDEQYFINTYRKIKVKLRGFELNEEVILDLLDKSNIKPITIERTVSKPNGLLVIPLFDMHFGINTYEGYIGHQEEIYKYIMSQEWEEILFIVGQDLLHNDDLKGNTSNQTPIEQVDMNKAVEDVYKFYDVLFETALSQSLNTKVIYSKGNHDESLSWVLMKGYERQYPQIEWDNDERKQHKAHIYKNVFIGTTHGDKSNDKKLAQVFNSLYRLPMAKANRRIILRGHLHTQKTIDEFGTTIMGLGTAAATDQWHEDNGYVGNHKSFELFIFNDDSLKGHMFIDGK